MGLKKKRLFLMTLTNQINLPKKLDGRNGKKRQKAEEEKERIAKTTQEQMLLRNVHQE